MDKKIFPYYVGGYFQILDWGVIVRCEIVSGGGGGGHFSKF